MSPAPWNDYYRPRHTGALPAGLQRRTTAILDRPDTAQAVRRIEGIAVPYDTWARVPGGWERFTRGAFTDSIATNPRVPLLASHDADRWPIGIAEQFDDRPDGLHVVWRIDVDDPAAAEALRKVEDGYLTGLSIGFMPDYRTDDLTVDRDGMAWITRHTARLLEVSLVSTPAYVGAQVTHVRCIQ